MKTELIKIKDLSNDPANVRKHDDRNLDAIKASLQRFGQQKPIVVDGKGIVVAGNGTLMGAKSLGWKEIQIVRTELEGADAVAYAIADNRTAELAIWDDDALAKTLEALKIDESIDEAITGFTDQEIDELIGSFDIEPIDDAPLLSDETSDFQQMTFILSSEQIAVVNDAIKKAKSVDTETDGNSNGNALFLIAQQYRV